MAGVRDDVRQKVLADLMAERARLVEDLAWIDRMLLTGGADPAPLGQPVKKGEPNAPGPTEADPAAKAVARRAPRKRKASSSPPSVRTLILDILASDDRWWPNSEVREALKERMGPDRPTDTKINNNMRASFHLLKQRGVLAHDPEQGYRMNTTAPADTESPAATGLSGTATASGQGGDDHAQISFPSDQDHDSPRRNGYRVDPSVVP